MNILDDLITSRMPNAKPSTYADLIDRLVWIVDHNKFDVMSSIERWLVEAEDVYKIQVALLLKEVFPFKEKAEFLTALALIRSKWPELNPLCDKLETERNRQLPNQ